MLLTKLLFGNHWHRSTRRGRHLPGPAAVRMGSTPGLVVMRKDFCRNRQPCAWVLSEPCIVRMPFAGFRRREEAEIASSKRKRLLGLRAARMAFAGIASSEGERASLRPIPTNARSERSIDPFGAMDRRRTQTILARAELCAAACPWRLEDSTLLSGQGQGQSSPVLSRTMEDSTLPYAMLWDAPTGPRV